ncbi:MAG: hypothetical protein ABRQ39_25850 [Candidatus Eremiobacterota bacterium]
MALLCHRKVGAGKKSSCYREVNSDVGKKNSAVQGIESNPAEAKSR